MTLLLSDADVRRATDYGALVDGIEGALKVQASGGAVVPARINLEHQDTWLRVMPAIAPSAGVMGLKVFHGLAGTGARYVILLYSLDDGALLATVDACYLTAARTAAASAVASRYLAAKGPARLGVIGSGLEAETHCAALAASGEIASIDIFSPDEERRRRFAERTAVALGMPVNARNSAAEATEAADHVVVATNTGPSMRVAYTADLLQHGQHITSIGSTNLRLRELDTAVFDRADVIVVDVPPEHLIEESGDLIEYYTAGGRLDAERTRTLPALVAGERSGRTSGDQLTLYKSVGTALQDVIAADLVYRRALELGLGNRVPDLCLEKPPAAVHVGERAAG